MKKAIISIICFLWLTQNTSAQSFGIGTDAPDAYAILDVFSTTKGVLIPRMTTAQRNAISGLNNVQSGLLIYNTQTDEFNYWDGTTWIAFPSITADTDDQMIDFFDLTGTTLSLSIQDDGQIPQTVDLSGFDQSTQVATNTSNIATNTSDITNIETSLVNHQNQIDNNNTLITDHITDDGDLSATNETITTAVLSGTTLQITEGGSTTNVDLSSLSSGEWTDGGTYLRPTDGITKEVTIGTSTPGTGKLTIDANEMAAGINIEKSGSFTTGNYGIDNNISNTGVGTSYGIRNEIGGLLNTRYGVWNQITQSSNPYILNHHGVYNNITSNGPGNRYGTFNNIDGSGTATKYGSYNIVAATASGTHYGIYSSALKASNAWAGYFLGDVSVGTTTGNIYTFPASRGTNGEVMQTDASGNISWVDPSTLAAATEWTDGGTVIYPTDGTNEDVAIGSASAGTGRLNVASNKTSTISFSNANNSASTTGISGSVTNNNTSAASLAVGGNFTMSGTGNGRIAGTATTINSSGNGYHLGTAVDIGNSGTGTHGGFESNLYGTGTGTRIGLSNLIYGTPSSGSNGHIGVSNEISSAGAGIRVGIDNIISGTGTGNKYGTRTNISASSGGTHYGVYSSVLKANSWAGYFLGDVSIGTTTGNIFTFPASRGTNGEVMQTDASGNLSWVDPSTFAAATEWTDFGAYIRPTDGANEDVAIGGGSGSGKLNITSNNSNYGIQITNTQSGAVESFGIRNYMNASTTSTLTKAGVQNYITTNATGSQYGTYNYLDNNSVSSKTGTINTLAGTTGAEQTGTRNGIVTTGNGIHYAVNNSISGTGNGPHYGTQNRVSGSGTGERTGTYNYMYGSGTGVQYGVWNRIAGSAAGTGTKYGSYNTIATTVGGTHYGVYSSALKASNAWAGYFLGDVSIGTTSANIFTFPASRGTNGEVMQTNATGQISWVDPASFADADWFEEGTGAAPNAITDDIYTQGNVGIGDVTPSYPLDITEATNTTLRGINLVKTDNTTGYTDGIHILKTSNGDGRNHGIYADVRGTGDGNRYGIYTDVTGTGTGQKYGIFNELNSAAAGNQYAVRNWMRSGTADQQIGVFNNLDNSGTGAQYAVYNGLRSTGSDQVRGVHNEFNTVVTADEFTGIRNEISLGTPGTGGFNGIYNNFNNANNGNYYGNRTVYGTSATGTGSKFGSYNLISSSAGGTHYGTYNSVSSTNGWAGYFAGKNYISDRLSIGETDNSETALGIRKNSGSTYAHMVLTETGANDGARIRFRNSNAAEAGSTEWTLFGRVDATLGSDFFNIYHEGTGNVLICEGNNVDGMVGIADRNPSTNSLEVNGNASKSVTGAWLANSDARLKKEIKPLDSKAMLEKVLKMQGVTYLWNDDVTGYVRPTETQFGFIAQDLKQIWPTKVSEDNDGFLQTAYGDYDAMFVEAFKAQQEMIKKQGQTINTLEEENQNLNKGIDQLNEKFEKLEKLMKEFMSTQGE